MAWKDEYQAFMIETYLKNGNCIIAIQQLFLKHFGVGWHEKSDDYFPWRYQKIQVFKRELQTTDEY